MKEQESKTKKIINDLSKKIDELLEQSDISKDDVKQGINTRIEELKKSRDQVNEEFKKIKEDNKEAFDKVEKLTKNTVKEVKSAFTGFFDKISGDKSKEDKKSE
jgi:uncharacterized coiled-coil DUF342 family protein